MTFQFQALGTVIPCDSPAECARYFVDHFSFEPAAQLDWYVSLTHASLPGHFLDFIQFGSEACPPHFRERPGMVFAFVVEDANRELARLKAAELKVAKEMVDEPWGQRLFRIAGPENLLIEIVQHIEPEANWMAAHSQEPVDR